MRALVLSGGGAKGAYEAGLITTLISEYHENFDIICGTSIGAINAAFLAQEATTELTTLWRRIGHADILAPLPKIAAVQKIFGGLVKALQARGLMRLAGWVGAGLTTLQGIRALHPLAEFSSLMGAIDPTNIKGLFSEKLRLEDVRRVLITTTTDIASGTAAVFCHFPAEYASLRTHFFAEEPGALAYQPDAFAEIIRASGAIPAAFSPVDLHVAGYVAAHVDGGVVNNTPIGQAVDAGATEVTVVYLDPLPDAKAAPRLPTSLAEILLKCFGLMQQRILDLDYQTALRVNDAVGADAADTRAKRIVKLRTFRPLTPLAVGALDFDKQDRIDAAFAQGREDAHNTAARLNWQQ